MVKNLYYEYSKWSLFWGLALDQKTEVQKVIETHNSDNWKVVQFEWNSSKYSIFKNILIFIITVFSFGFISHWSGFSIVFEKVNNSSQTLKKETVIEEVVVNRDNLFK